MKEADLSRLIQVAASKKGARLFRNNVGLAWTGKPCAGCKRHMKRLRYGLCKGSSDNIGWQPITITPEMVGRKIAVFVACEVKTERGITSDAQARFLKAVILAGGRGFIARNLLDVVTALA